MKKSFPFLLSFLLLCSNKSWSGEINSAFDYLKAMQKAHHQLNYEQLYILQQGENVESLRYRHANWQGKEYAQLLELDYSRSEILLKDNIVGYFGEFQPFSLSTSRIVDNLPNILYTDFNQLKDYHFVDSGKMRVADRLARIIRVIPHDDFRYQYELWIDEENHLLLRSDLLDRERNLLEQFRVIRNTVDNELLSIVEPIEHLIFPTFIPAKEASTRLPKWKLEWLPSGFQMTSHSYHSLPSCDNEQVESLQYSDGLSLFSIYFTKNKGVTFDDQFWREGKTSIYSQTIGDTDIIIIGDIPLVSARHILQKIQKI